MKKIIAGLLLFTIVSSSCKFQSKDDKKIDKNLDQLKNNPNINVGDGTYSITPLEGWDKKDTLMRGVKFTFIYAPDNKKEGLFSPNMNILSEKLPSSYSLDEYIAVSKKNMKLQLNDVEEKGDGEEMIDGTNAKWSIYKHTYSGINIDVLVYFILKENIAYVISCSTLSGKMPKLEQDFRTIVRSFKSN